MAEKDWLDELLRANRPAPVADDGFTDRLMTHLPVRPRRARQWLVPTAALIGAALAIVVSGTSVDLGSAVLSLLTDQRISAAAFLPALLVFAGCAWALSESR